MARLTTTAIGLEAETTDGQLLGIISEVDGDYVRVEADDAEAHWLRADAVDDPADGRVRLDFREDEFDSRVAAVPPGEIRRAPDDRGPLPSELEQRKMMLADMAEDREKLREDGVDMPDERDTVGEPVEEELERLEGGRASDG